MANTQIFLDKLFVIFFIFFFLDRHDGRRMALRGCVEPLESVGRTSKTVGRYSYLFLVAEKRGQERSTSFHWINLTQRATWDLILLYAWQAFC